jgi:hypothetical protein
MGALTPFAPSRETISEPFGNNSPTTAIYISAGRLLRGMIVPQHHFEDGATWFDTLSSFY